jgi:hypothetical protein
VDLLGRRENSSSRMWDGYCSGDARACTRICHESDRPNARLAMASHLQIRASLGRAVMTAWRNARVTARRTARGNACVHFSRTGGKQLSTRMRDGRAGSEPPSSFARWSELQRAEAAEGEGAPGRPSPSGRLRVPMVGSRMRHRGERSPADSTFTPPHAGSRVRFAGVVPGAQGEGIEEAPPGSWPQRIGRPDR